MQSNVDKTLREFSAIGPCLDRLHGKITRETPKSWFYMDRDGDERRVKKSWRFHVDPCVSCRDHERTQYPNGYMD